MQTFNEQIENMQNARHREHFFEANARDKNGDNIYLWFCVWCNINGDSTWKTSPKKFAEYLKAENVELGFWQRKSIAEKYFGYAFTYQNGDWVIKKEKRQ